MPCVDQDKFNLLDHGHSLDVALNQLLRVPAIANGVLGDIIIDVQQKILPIVNTVNWIPANGNNAGNATGFFEKDNGAVNKIKLKRVDVTLMEGKRSQVIHELVHGLDMYYYFFNLSSPPLGSKLNARVPVLYLFPLGNVWKYEVMDMVFVDPNNTDAHNNLLTQFKGLARNNSLLKQWQRTMLMTQLDYASGPMKLHVEFTANVAQCLSLIYQWGFTGNEKGLLGNPRSIAILIKAMERALLDCVQTWRRYVPPARKPGSVVQFKPGDRREPDMIDPNRAIYFQSDQWWKKLGKNEPELVMPPDVPPKPTLGRVPPPVPPKPLHLRAG
ncbi:MAG TPA: hypothetical protein VHP37_17085 [Burkholderiales bacterium]|nr:hypothetical protein [Burkholderiales bacterium]